MNEIKSLNERVFILLDDKKILMSSWQLERASLVSDNKRVRLEMETQCKILTAELETTQYENQQLKVHLYIKHT
jgi:hypothetical protein